MSFNYVDFLDQHGIEYKTNSPNAGRGEVAVKCPWCGQDDPSEHLSINLEGRGWVCRRTKDLGHRGRSPNRLVRALIGCSAQEAARIVGSPILPGVGDLLSQVEALIGEPHEEIKDVRGLYEPREFRKFEGKPSERPYLRYMVERGFSEKFVRRASAEMGLRYCTLGPFAKRVVFLVHQEGRLVNWTGRSISKYINRRYQAHTPDLELAERWGLAPAALSIERCLLWYDDLLEGGPLLEVVEGPMDSLKLRSLGHQTTCLFTNSPSDAQVDLLRELAPRFERRAILLDRGAEVQAMDATSRLAALGFRTAWLPVGVKDPGVLTVTSARGILYC